MTERAPAADARLQQVLEHVNTTSDIGAVAAETTPYNTFTSAATLPGSRLSSAATSSIKHGKSGSSEHEAVPSTAEVTTQGHVLYRSAGIQTLPPSNADGFRKIYDREPTHQELVSKIGSAALGRYKPGPSAHDVVQSAPFPAPDVSNRRANYVTSSFQTKDVAQCKKDLLKAKVKASLLVNKQRDAALSAGYKVWSETRDDYIVHSEQLDTSVQFDHQGNAANANVDGLSLPNIYGEEIEPRSTITHPTQLSNSGTPETEAGVDVKAREYTFSAASSLTPPPTPPSLKQHDASANGSTPQHIRTVKTCIPSEKSDPPSIEDYGYVQLVPQEARKQDADGDSGQKQMQRKRKSSEVSEEESTECQKQRPTVIESNEGTVIAFGGEKFADEYIVYDATMSNNTNSDTSSRSPSNISKKRKSVDQCEPEVTTRPPKRFKSSATHTDPSPIGTDTNTDHFVHDKDGSVARNDATSAMECTQYNEASGVATRYRGRSISPSRPREGQHHSEDNRHSRNSRRDRESRRRSRSPGAQRDENDYSARSSTRQPSESPYQEGRRLHMTESQPRQTGPTHGLVKSDAKEQKGTEKQAQRSSDLDETVLERKKEDDRRMERAKQITDEKREKHRQQEETEIQRAKQITSERVAKRRQQEEAEIQRAREAKNERRLEIEEKKRAQEEEYRHQEEERDKQRRRRRRDDSQERSSSKRATVVEPPAEPAAPVDRYALAREVEARRREKMFAARSTGEMDSRAHERSAATNKRGSRLEVEPRKPEKKVEDDKVSKPRAKPRPSRTARGEIERYDPKKRFGRGE
ncbi:hypothetical protein J4E83_004202 [Alternaria metachromatica]|uniref:uncharacterized protein n=1 Tax=Alternaria metachromatica TaxID=283354 RepID=UPI0020C45B08|nr:uncharacterized protein J4E83_004202 [Alternaria metachromatica]XP_049239579.1 uncharacterized protein J4E84_010073 [Alternaria hordeiaustralica]KAI4624527.1 hypothetical protein J4E83_004202 [Alternaria metachromatica]KAI4675331.1 hypothetical protein J4E84_010073 [Alternaria hordeiaustralica]